MQQLPDAELCAIFAHDSVLKTYIVGRYRHTPWSHEVTYLILLRCREADLGYPAALMSCLHKEL
eukprot:36972-Eustigmatos_ZCMA.PRE.1